MDLWILLVLAIAGVAGTVEVHFENKDGGFFLKHTPRQYYQAVADLAGGGGVGGGMGERRGGGGGGAGSSVLSVDRFTVFQTSQPISIRATYGPFSTKQTVPARYIVPDPLDALPLPDPAARPSNASLSAASPSAAAAAAAALLDLDLSAAASHHLDMSAHVVRGAVARDSPVLRVLFHAGADPGARRRLLLGRHRRVCIVLHASLGERAPLTAACSPDGEDGVCLAQVTVPAAWWAPLPPPDASGRPGKPVKTPQRLVQVAYSVLEPGTDGDGGGGGGGGGGGAGGGGAGCQPRVQIQPVTPLGTVPLAPARAAYRELRLDEALSMLLPHAPLYPLSRLHVPVFLQAPAPGARRHYTVSMFVIRARVKSGLRLLGAEAASEQWNVSADINPKHTVATVTAFRREPPPDQQQAAAAKPQPPWGAEEVFTWLLEVSEDAADLYDGGRVVWSVRYVLDGADAQPPPPAHPHGHAHGHRAGGGGHAAAAAAAAANALAHGRAPAPTPSALAPEQQAPPVPRHHKPRASPAAAAAAAAAAQMAPKEAAALSPAVATAPTPSAAASAAYAAAADAPLSAAQLSPNFVEYPSSGMMGMLGGGQRRGNSPEVKRATIVGNPMFSAMEGAADLNDDFRPKEDLLGLDDFNLTMDYDQLVEYFDNLKESNA